MKEKTITIIDWIFCALIGLVTGITITLNILLGLFVLLLFIFFHILRWKYYEKIRFVICTTNDGGKK